MPPASLPALAAINPGPSTAKSLRSGDDRLKRKRDRACFLRSARSAVLSFRGFWPGVSMRHTRRKEETRVCPPSALPFYVFLPEADDITLHFLWQYCCIERSNI